MKKLLIISTFFPPRQHTATQRTLAWIKYLDRTQFSIEVLVPAESGRNVPELEAQYNIKIHQIECSRWPGLLRMRHGEPGFIHKLKALHNKVFYNLNIDEWPEFTRAAIQYLTKSGLFNNIDLVLSSYAPVGPHLIARRLKKLIPNLFWIADFRDEMSLGETVPLLLRKQLHRLEGQIVSAADLVTSVSLPLLNDFKKHSSNSDKFLEIKNGFDFEQNRFPKPKSEKIKLGYLGTFYGDREPSFLFKALVGGLNSDETSKHNFENIEIHIYGNNGKLSVPDEIRNQVFIHEPINYDEVPQTLATLDGFLLLHPTTSRLGVYTSKLFDYLAVNRPILALVDPKDVAAKTILETQSGLVFENQNFTTETLKRFLDFTLNFQATSKNWNEINFFSRKEQVSLFNRNLARMLNEKLQKSTDQP